jgi:hypothetical protein
MVTLVETRDPKGAAGACARPLNVVRVPCVSHKTPADLFVPRRRLWGYISGRTAPTDLRSIAIARDGLYAAGELFNLPSSYIYDCVGRDRYKRLCGWDHLLSKCLGPRCWLLAIWRAQIYVDRVEIMAFESSHLSIVEKDWRVYSVFGDVNNR